MNRTVKMIGRNLLYEEVRSGSTADDGREIVMEGDKVRYREVAGVAAVEEQTVVAEVEATATAGALPECLATERALGYWQQLREAGFVDGSGQLLKTTTRQQACLIAEEFARSLGVEHVKWKLFQEFWGVSNLAQDRSFARGREWNPPRAEEIKGIFSKSE